MSRKKTFEEFVLEAKKKHPNIEYQYDKETYIDTHTKMRIICPIHGEFWQSPGSHLLYECNKCSYEKRAKNYVLTNEEFIKKARKIHGDKYDYSKVEYKGTKTPVIIICSKHGEFRQKPNDHLNNKGCPICNESKLEKEVRNILIENNISFESQKKFSWLGKQSLDFYLPDYNIGIECQGKQHLGKGGWKKDFNFNELFQRDIIKYNICLKNNIKIIYFSNILDFKNFTLYSKNNFFVNKEDLLKHIKKE